MERIIFIVLIAMKLLLTDNDARASYESSETGWVSYVDTTYTVSSPFTITAGTMDTLENNAQTVLSDQKPKSVVNWYNTSTKKLTPSYNGDWYNVVIRFKAKTTANNDYFIINCNIGGAVGYVYEETMPMVKGANTEQLYTIKMNVYTAATFVSNGGVVSISANTGNLSIYNISYTIARLHRART